MKNFKLKSTPSFAIKEVAIAFLNEPSVGINGKQLQSEYKGKTFNASPQTSGTYTQQLAHATQVVRAHINRNK